MAYSRARARAKIKKSGKRGNSGPGKLTGIARARSVGGRALAKGQKPKHGPEPVSSSPIATPPGGHIGTRPAPTPRVRPGSGQRSGGMTGPTAIIGGAPRPGGGFGGRRTQPTGPIAPIGPHPVESSPSATPPGGHVGTRKLTGRANALTRGNGRKLGLNKPPKVSGQPKAVPNSAGVVKRRKG